jgi:LacI family transcriptional regulator
MAMTARPDRLHRVVLLTAPSELLLRGIGRYAERAGNWSFEFLHPGTEALAQLRSDPPDGIIAYIWTDEQARLLTEIGCPVVNHSGAVRTPAMGWVCCDSVAAGALAAEHFLDHGFCNFAYLGNGEALYSREREAGFRERLAEHQFTIRTLQVQASPYPTRRERSPEQDRVLAEWLRALPEHTGVFACSDYLGWWVTEIASANDIRVPDRLAVLGMDDQAMCLLSRPPLSSIQYPTERIGYHAASLLDSLMRGTAPRMETLVAPQGVAARQSTDILAMRDHQIAAGLRFIRKHYAEPIRVTHVAKAAGLNRRTFEMRFREALGRTPAQEIRRARLDAAKELLGRTDLSIEDVVEHSGFSSRRWLSRVLVDATGLTPAAYRRSVSIPDR